MIVARPDGGGSPAASTTGATVADLWALTGSDPAPAVDVRPATVPVASGFAVADLASATAGAATAAIEGLADEPAPVAIDTDHVLADWCCHVEVGGEPVPAWAPLSGRYPTRDGRPVQLHCNFPHHAAGVAARLGVAEVRAEVAAAVATWDAFELERVLIDDGMICAAYRSLDEWAEHPHAGACAALPLLEIDQIGEADPLPATSVGHGLGGALDGVRVLDCSRVLAGPVCGRTLAAHGADVLRIGAAHLPSVQSGVLATGFGKRNADLDLRTPDGSARFAELLAGADVFVDAYRPGALAGLGFSAERAAAERAAAGRRGIVVIEICGFDWVGPWAGRRGFDSIVQSTTGIAVSQAEVTGSTEPVHLPVQALDYATGYLAAFAAARLLARQRTVGGSWRARLSLLRTRNWLVGLGGPEPFEPGSRPPVDRFLHDVDSPFGTLRAVAPIAGRWDRPPSPLGSSRPEWLSGEHPRG